MVSVTTDQFNIIRDPSRFKVTVAGRRWGKTHLAIYDSLFNDEHGIYKKAKLNNWYVSPTYRQSKLIAWNLLKEICFDYPMYIKEKNESELYIKLINDSILTLKGADKEDSLRGVGLNHVILDEFEFMKVDAWKEVIRPALSDKKGSAMFIGTPDGFGNLYEVYTKGLSGEDGYKSWHYKTIDSPFIDPIEIEQAKNELDERTFRQEYEASFETVMGRVYYCFNRESNVKRIERLDGYKIIVCVDFNVNPMKWCLLQDTGKELRVFDEIIKQNTNTEEMARTVGDIYGYDYPYTFAGDYSGTFRSTNSRTTDYDIIQQILPNTEIKTRPNPAVVDRINAVNAKLKNTKGERFLFIDEKCKHLIKDFEQVIWKEDKREIEKGNMELTHISDAIGYYINYEYSLKGKPIVTRII